MRYVKVNGPYAYQHKGNRLEVIEPGSVVMMADDLAERFVARGMGDWDDGPERLIRPGKDSPDVERPGHDPRPARAEQMTGRPQRAGAV